MNDKNVIDTNAAENINTNVNADSATLTQQNYEPTSENCNTTGTVVPAALKYEQMKAIETVDRRVNGIDEYIRTKLEYDNLGVLCKLYSAEQVDSLGLAIWNLENKKKATIIGDGTGVGKGRQAAGLIRYAHIIGKIPVFITEKPNLFTDIYRDLIDTGSDDGIIYRHLLDTKKQQKVRIDRKRVEGQIIDDLQTGEFALDAYNVNTLTDNLNADGTQFTGSFRKTDEFKNLINEYIDLYFTTEYEEVDQFKLNANFEADVATAKRRMVPFVVNGRTNKTLIKDKAGNIIYEPNTEQVNGVVKSHDFVLYDDGDFIMATYSQFRSRQDTDKKQFLKNIAHKCLFIFDESHNAAGASNTGGYFQEVIAQSFATIFLSATFAKRPDNMQIYAGKTSIGDADLTPEQLEAAFIKGGVALQEVVSAQLTKEGEYIRRERSYEGVKVNYRTLDKSQETDFNMPQLNKEDVHIAYADEITAIIRDIIRYQKDYIDPAVEGLDAVMAAEQGKAGVARGDREGGIKNSPAFSGVFNLINQMLLAINCEAVADLAIEELRNGRKPIIALSNTMESFLDDVTLPNGDPVKKGDVISVTFSHVLKRRLKNASRYREELSDGTILVKYLHPEELSMEAMYQHQHIQSAIDNASAGLVFSPIDMIRKRITEAGFTFEEVTGRDRIVDIYDDGEGMVKDRKKRPVDVIFREFNENKIDCLLINQSGATGASAHAMILPGKVDVINYDKKGNKIIPNALDPRNEVKQRTMIVLQPELDINIEVQKRGRVNRTGQVFPPKYDYVTSAIPAQMRLMMMLQKKLKSLDANSTGNQKESKKVLDIQQDFLNKIGDDIVIQYLISNPNINAIIDNPLKFDGANPGEETRNIPDRANKVAGRIAILPVEWQRDFYDNMGEMYLQEVERLKQMDEYDLEVEFLNYKAKTLERTVINGGDVGKSKSYFTRNVVLEKIEIDNLKKPFKLAEIKAHCKKNRAVGVDAGGNPITIDNNEAFAEILIKEMSAYYQAKEVVAIEGHKEKFERNLADLEMKKKKGKSSDYLAEKQTLIAKKDHDVDAERQHYISLIRKNKDLFEFFQIGKMYNFPEAGYADHGRTNRSIFMGFKINRKASNPWAASAIQLEFAMDNPLKQMNVPSNRPEVAYIQRETKAWFLEPENQKDLIANWDNAIKESSTNRTIRYVLTGNLLKAFAMGEILATLNGEGKSDNIGGRLVSYNLLDDPSKKKQAYLLPQSFSMVGKDMASVKVSIPIFYLNDYFKTASKPQEQLTYIINPNMAIRVSKTAATIELRGMKRIWKKYTEDVQLQQLFGKDWKIYGNQSATISMDNGNSQQILDYLWATYRATVSVSQAMADNLGINTHIEYEDEETVVMDPLAEINGDYDSEDEKRKEQERNERENVKQLKAERDATKQKLEVEKKKNKVYKQLDELIKLLQAA